MFAVKTMKWLKEMQQDMRATIHSSLPPLHLSVKIRSYTDSSGTDIWSSDFTGNRLLGIQTEHRHIRLKEAFEVLTVVCKLMKTLMAAMRPAKSKTNVWFIFKGPEVIVTECFDLEPVNSGWAAIKEARSSWNKQTSGQQTCVFSRYLNDSNSNMYGCACDKIVLMHLIPYIFASMYL